MFQSAFVKAILETQLASGELLTIEVGKERSNRGQMTSIIFDSFRLLKHSLTSILIFNKFAAKYLLLNQAL
jgi:hypothetical protein